MSEKVVGVTKPVVRVRISATPVLVEAVATLVGELLEGRGYEVLEQSAPYPSRYDDGEARVFLLVR